MKSFAGLIVAFSMTFTSMFAFAAGPQCSDVNLRQYMKTGSVEDQAPDKIYRFADMRDDIIANISDPRKTKCLNDAYQSGLEQEAQYWGKRLNDAGCSLDADGDVADDCPIADEVRESNEFLYNLEHDSNADIRRAVEVSRDWREEQTAASAPAPAPVCTAAPASTALTKTQLHEISCCGSPTSPAGEGAVRINEPQISYQECLGKIGKNTHSVADSVISCAGSVVKGAISAIWEAIKGLWHLPAMIGQVWSLMTNSSARQAFFDKMMGYVKAKKQAVFSCYNGHEIAQEACRDVGALIAMCAAPESATALIGILAKPLSALARAKAIEGVLATTSRGRAAINKMGRGKAAAEKAVGAARSTGRVAARTTARTGRAVVRGARAIGSRIPGKLKSAGRVANQWRRTLGRPLSIPAEKLALRASQSGVYKRMLQRAVRAEEQARGRATGAGGLAGRAANAIPRSAALMESTGGAGGSSAGASTKGNSASNIPVDLNAPMPTTALRPGARLGTVPEGGTSFRTTYTQNTNPLAGRELRPGARLGTVPEGGTSFNTTVRGQPAAPAPDVNVSVRVNGGEARAVPKNPFEANTPRVQADTPKARELNTLRDELTSDIRRISEPSTPRAAGDTPNSTGAAPDRPMTKRDAVDLHERVTALARREGLSPAAAGKLHDEINARFFAATGERLPGAGDIRRGGRGDSARLAARERREAVAADAAPATAADTSSSANAAVESTTTNAASSATTASQPRVVVRRVVRTETELTNSRNYLDRFSTKVEKLAPEPSVRERAGLFRAARADKVHAEADGLHAQVDDLIAANRITTTQASSYHSNIALAESFATRTPVGEWTPPAPVELPVVNTPVRRLTPNEPEAPVADLPNEPVDVITPPDAPVPPVTAPSASAAARPAQPVANASAAAPSSAPAPLTRTPLKPSERKLAADYQTALDEVAPPIGPRASSATSYYDRGTSRTWMGTGERIPDQGWKLHVSATPEKAEKIAELLLPELRRMNIGHQVAKDMREYMARSATDPQYGKFITIFPKTAEEARRVAALTEKMMKKAGLKADDFPTPPGDQIAGVGVFARYGRMTGGPLRGPNGELIPNSTGMIRSPEGTLIPDRPAEPFEFAGQLIEARAPGRLQRASDAVRRDLAKPANRGGAVVPTVRLLAPTPTPSPRSPSANAPSKSVRTPRAEAVAPSSVTAPAEPARASEPDQLMDIASDAASDAASEAAAGATAPPPSANP